MPVTGVVGQLSRGAPYELDGNYIADGTIAFGAVVELSATDKAKQVRAFTGSGPIWGIALEDPTKGFTRDANGLATEVTSYSDGNPVIILRKGTCYVSVPATTVKGSVAYVDVTDGINDDASGTAITSGFFLTGCTGAGTVELSINLPQ